MLVVFDELKIFLSKSLLKVSISDLMFKFNLSLMLLNNINVPSENT